MTAYTIAKLVQGQLTLFNTLVDRLTLLAKLKDFGVYKIK